MLGDVERRNLELRHMRAFVAVAEEHSFTRAAEKLHLVQQALSAQIGQLEERLGARVFDRTTRGVELTDAGRVLLARATPILEAVAAAWEETVQASRIEHGTIVLMYPPAAGFETIRVILEAFRSRYPGVAVQRCEHWWQAASVEGVLNRQIDVGFSRGDAPLADRIEQTTVRADRFGVILGAGHRLAGAEKVVIADLGADTLYLAPRAFAPAFHDRITAGFRERGFAGEVCEFESLGRELLLSDDRATAEVAAGRGVGVGVARRTLPAPFVWRPIDPPLLIPLAMYWHRDAGATVRAFTSCALDVAARERWLPPVEHAVA